MIEKSNEEDNKERLKKDRLVYRKTNMYKVTPADMYKWFKHNEWSKDKTKDISQTQYYTFIKIFFQKMADKMIKDNFIFIMPWKLGSMYIKKKKRPHKHKVFDWKHYNETGEKRKHLNLHSFGIRYKLTWDKKLAHFKNIGMYAFNARSYVRKTLGRVIRERSIKSGVKSYDSH